jgi:TRAP-type mannitol/chloroaromatic compound transport system permease large subunit
VSPGVIALIMLGILVITIMIGFPVAFTLMALGVGFGYYAYYQPGTDFFDNRTIDAARGTWRMLGERDGIERHFWKQDGGRWVEGP